MDGFQEDNYNSLITDQKNIQRPTGSSRNIIRPNYQTLVDRPKGDIGSQSNLMYSTLTSASQANQTKFKDVLRMKLSYEWKKLYRLLSMQDTTAQGLISPAAFEKAAV